MKIRLPDLTPEQVDAVLRIGDPKSVNEAIQSDVIDQLIHLGILYQRADKHLDFTNVGDHAYQTLAPKHGYPARWSDR